MLLVADTSPLISLILIKQLKILFRLYPDFVVPLSVMNELKNHKTFSKFSSEISSLMDHSRKVKRKIPNPDENLGKGEWEAILLYQELNADRLLIDDKYARSVAEKKRIHCIGTLTLLFQAKNIGLIPVLKPVFENLKKHGRYYSDDLFLFFLKKADEE